MDIKVKQAFVVSLITMLCACGTTPSDISNKEKNDKWIGLTVDELIVVKGEPVNVYTIAKGGRIFEYLKQAKIKTITRSARAGESTLRSVRAPDGVALNTQSAGTQSAGAQFAGDGTRNARSEGEFDTGDRVARIRAKRKAKKMEADQGCTILFNISASDIIVGWSVEGEQCN